MQLFWQKSFYSYVSAVHSILFFSSCLEWRYTLPLLEEAGLETWAMDILGWGFSDLGLCFVRLLDYKSSWNNIISMGCFLCVYFKIPMHPHASMYIPWYALNHLSFFVCIIRKASFMWCGFQARSPVSGTVVPAAWLVSTLVISCMHVKITDLYKFAL